MTQVPLSFLYWWGTDWLAQSYWAQEPGFKHRQSDVTASSLRLDIMLLLIKAGLNINMLLIIEIVISNLICAHILLQECDHVSWSLINGCLSGPLKCSIVLHTSREVFVYWRSLHILRHTSLLVKRHFICPYLLFTVNQWAENSSQESVFVVACHGKWARIPDALLHGEPICYTVCQAFFLLVNWRPGQLKCKNLFHKRQKMLYTQQNTQGEGFQPNIDTWSIYFMSIEPHLDWDWSKISWLLHRQFSLFFL